MPLVESLVNAIVRADGDALVMHVGTRPFVVTPGGPIELSSHPLDGQAMARMLTNLLPYDSQRTLHQSGSVEYELPPTPAMLDDRFTILVTRGGDNIWIDVRRHRRPKAERSSAAERQSAPTTAAPGMASPLGGAEVIPMTRRRTDVAATTPRPSVIATRAERLLAMAVARGATTVYMTSDAAPFLRIDGEVRVLDGIPALSGAEVEGAVAEFAPEAARERLYRGDVVEWSTDVRGIGRVNCRTFRDYRGLGAVFHLASARPATAEQLGLAQVMQALATETDGLVLVATPRQQGKTTIAGAFVDFINHRRHCYVVTFERQIRVVHEQVSALVSQRELHSGGDGAVAHARAALAENPDVLVIDELPSLEMLQLALDAAGSGALVIATIAAGSAASALRRLIDLVPEARRSSMHGLIAARLRGAVAQVLLHKSAGGRIAARELLLATTPVQTALAAGKLSDLPLAIERGQKHGLTSLNHALVDLVRTGAVDVREAYRKADDREGLLAALKRESIDLSIVERLA